MYLRDTETNKTCEQLASQTCALHSTQQSIDYRIVGQTQNARDAQATIAETNNSREHLWNQATEQLKSEDSTTTVEAETRYEFVFRWS